MMTLTIEIPDREANDVLTYVKQKGGSVISESLYSNLDDENVNPMGLAYAEASLKAGWDLSDEENDYWSSFAK